MSVLQEYKLEELKLIYRVLHDAIPAQPSLMDSQILDELQRYLQQKAQQDGVDVSLHAQWADWLQT